MAPETIKRLTIWPESAMSELGLGRVKTLPS